MEIALNDEFIKDNTPFILSTICRTTKKYENSNESEYLTIGMLAFCNAIETYEAYKGGFYTYAAKVITNKVIDELRKENKWRVRNVELSEDIPSEADYEGELFLTLEMSRYVTLLEAYGLSIDKLAKSTPKHKDSRRHLIDLALRINGDPLITTQLIESKKMDTKRIVQNFNVSRKLLYLNKNYLISIIIAYYYGIIPVMDWIEELKRGK